MAGEKKGRKAILMSKSLIFSDLHLNSWSYGSHITDNGFNSRLWQQWLAIEEMINDAEDQGCKFAYFCGDLTHTHGQVQTQVQVIATRLFKELRNRGIKIRAIPGNHDMYDRRGTIHSLSFLADEEISGSWVDEDQRVLALPYTTDEGVLKRFLSKAAGGGESTLLLLHQGVSGLALASGFVLDERLTPDMIPDNCRAFAGHYHQHAAVRPNLTVVGCLTPLNWSDIDASKGWLIWDRSTGDLEQKIQTASPEFVTHAGSDMSYVGMFVRYTEPVHYSEQHAIREALIKEGALSVDFPTMKIENTTDNIREGEGITAKHLADEFAKQVVGRRGDVGREVRAANYQIPELRE